MDSVFYLDEEVRTRFLQNLAQSLGCTYLCLWSYYPLPANYLFSTNGVLNYNAIVHQPASSSSASIASQAIIQTLFDAYRSTPHIIQNGLVPGLAFLEGIPYLEFKELELLNRASTDIQRQFYQEARIKLAAFASCKSGAMEIGMSSLDQSKNIEMEMMNWFPDDFILQQSKLVRNQQVQLPQRIDQSWPSSSSSSLKSLVSSPEYSPLLFSAPTAFPPQEFIKEVITSDHQTSKPNLVAAQSIDQQIEHAYNILGNVQFPNPENVDAALTKAMLAVLSSTPASSSLPHQHQHQQTQACSNHLSQEVGVFKRYKPEDNLLALANNKLKTNYGGQNMLKRAIIFYKNMQMRKRIMEEQLAQGYRPTSSQLHHKMSERKRREKLNDSFLALKSLLPPGSKKDKVSLLSITRDYLVTLKDEIKELKRRNRFLETQLAPTKPTLITSGNDPEMGAASTSSDITVEIQLTEASEPSILSEEREVDLQVNVRSRYCDFMSLIRCLLEFLNQVDGVTLEFMEGNTTPAQVPNSSYGVVIRLKIKASQQHIFEESAFKEAIRRIIGDAAK
ncbi:hypothetical protein C5167_018178 [Papaver somniferum]|uniref:BHLH domain-containing protein n=1 Tax=Papaver somniferum TaxID=3469 RepID=A0A4Y7IQK4_PAPSO|nr:putative transcription factor bHLH041 isoform X1 [Papaver somniferum]RZC49758.1 hypothetical protein C5167_018178 [Papaver somniferum]